MLNNIVYFDNAATTRMDERVLEAMLPYLGTSYGNASAKYSIGFEARKAVNTAREQTAAFIGASPDEIYFTSGATESNNTALRLINGGLITSSAEHPSVLNTAYALKSKGRKTCLTDPDDKGRVTASAVSEAFKNSGAGNEKAGLLSVMTVNNELGTINPVKELAAIAHEKGWLFHTDAVQVLGHLNINVKKSGTDLLSASAHKLYGPKGTGFLYIRRGLNPKGFMQGGSQERGLRPGTENVAGIVGLGAACETAMAEMQETSVREKQIGEYIKKYILENIPDTVQNGDGERILNFSFKGVNGTSLVLRLDIEGICVSTGSACSLGTEEVSHVLRAIKLDNVWAQGSLRISIGKYNTMSEAEILTAKIRDLTEELRSLTV